MSKKETSWGGVASWYDELLETGDDSYQSKVILPNLLRILDPKPGMNVLDIACGQGFFARALALGGSEVTGCDISGELIALAKAKGGQVKYETAPSDKLSFAGDQSFDAVIIVLALQNIENLAGTFSEASRVLKKSGRLIIVMNHPAFRVPKRSGWAWSDEDAKQYRRIDAYMSDNQIEVDMNPGERDPKRKKVTVSFHRPLQSYFKFLNKSGLCVTRFEEWISHKKSEKGPKAEEEDRMRKEIPMFVMIESRKD